jgi:hypothetical protein
MNIQGNFAKIGDADVSMLKDLVLQLTSQHWSGDTTRQDRYEAHQDTQSIGLVYDLDFRHRDPTRLAPLELFGPAIQHLLANIAHHYETSTLMDRMGNGYFSSA